MRLDCDERSWYTPFDLSDVVPEDLPEVEVAMSYQQAGGEAIAGFHEAGGAGIVTAGNRSGRQLPRNGHGPSRRRGPTASGLSRRPVPARAARTEPATA